MGEVELRWLIAGVGIIILILIWLWGSRKQPGEGEVEQADNLRSPDRQPRLDTERTADAAAATSYHFGGLGSITPEHHLADKVLVDVEITPVSRSISAEEAAAAVEQPEVDRQDVFPGSEAAAVLEAEAVEPEPLPETERESPEPALPLFPVEPVETTPTETRTAGDANALTVLLTVIAPPGRPFRGPSILMAAQELKLKLHKSGVFDYFPRGEIRDKPVFGVAHLWEPGTFELDTIGKLSTPGLLMFMNLPGSTAPVDAVDKMIQTARQLAQKLGGTVCNDRRERMTNQAFMKLKSAAADLEKRLGSR